ncbi:MAG: hypothetical protein JWN48_4022 [Myxococcaceae bacterium]|nr:hypothetical protein [Myxococcaceae bacterium]
MVSAQLVPELLLAVRALTASAGAADRHALIASLLARTRPPLTELPAQLPARLSALLARHLPRAEARRVLSAAPLARAGFEPATDLLPRLLRIARHEHKSARAEPVPS